MYAIKEIREFYGMNQVNFARYVGVTRSQLSMAELGLRELKGEAFMQLLKLFMEAMKADVERTKVIKQHTKIENQKSRHFVSNALQSKRSDLERVRMDLDNLKKDYRKILVAIAAFPKIHKELPLEVSEIMKMKNNRVLRNSGMVNQLKLELRIKTLQAEIRFLENAF